MSSLNIGAELQVSRGIELLRRLRQIVTDFAKKEEQLSRELGTRRYRINQQFQQATEETESDLAERSSEEQSALTMSRDWITRTYENRRTHTQRAQLALIRSLPRRAQQKREEWLGNLQMRQFNAERAHAAGLSAAAAALAERAALLNEKRAALAALERHAQQSFSGYLTFWQMIRRRLAADAKAHSHEASGEDWERALNIFEASLRSCEDHLKIFDKLVLPRLFKRLPLPAWIIFIAFVGFGAAYGFRFSTLANDIVGAVCALFIIALIVLHRIGMSDAKPAAISAIDALAKARESLALCRDASQALCDEEKKYVQDEFDRTSDDIRANWERAGDVEAEFEKTQREKHEAQAPRVLEKIDELLQSKLARIETEHGARAEEIASRAELRKQQFNETHEREIAALAAEENELWANLEADWQREIASIYKEIDAINQTADSHFPTWSEAFVESWQPAKEFIDATKFARLEMDLARQGAIPKSPRLALPGSPQVSVPLALTYPDHGSLLFETNDASGAEITGTLNNIVLRLLSTTPPGKLSFTILDPVGLGQNFAGLMHLSDYEESLINRRIWTQRDQIEERLAELSEHIEKVIQMYLRNEYATITEYNERAGSVAEKYHFLIVADFPAQFSETAAQRLQSIAASGPRCGVFTLMHWDKRQASPGDFVAEEVRKNSIVIRREHSGFILNKEQVDLGAKLVFERPPEPELAAELVHKIGKSSVDSNRVEVPFEQIAPPLDELWKGDTTSELRVAIGRTGATKLQYLAIGKGTRQHALFVGKTGSGKSTLFHVIITNLALACSPEQVEFYLIDFKKGVEFKCYAEKRLPHARVIAIESDREFALSVLHRVDEELKRRGDMFRKLGVQDIAGYKKAGGKEPVPRTLLIIDEFQEFFIEDDLIAQNASLLFDRIVRQGRAFGIHVLLGSQTLGGAYTLARTTIGQMVIRVALQCNEADAYLIMDDNNPAPRLLSRPGEGIYNDAAGALEGNSPFQVVWLSDHERDEWLEKVHELAVQHNVKQAHPIVFEGNAPADVRENDLLESLLENEPTSQSHAARVWLGAPNSIKGPTEAVFSRQSGNNLLIVGQRDEAALTMVGLSLLALAAQHPVGSAKFVLLDNSPAGSSDANFLESIRAAIPHEVTIARTPTEITEAMNGIAAELKARSSGEQQVGTEATVFLFIHGLQRFKKLRHEDDFDFSMSSGESAPKPSAQLNELITEGSSYGMHIIATVDTFNNVNRFLSRKALTEFEMRIVFQMSASDSASLIDSPAASNLGLHRAIFYNEQQGHLETFRPYATPNAEWLAQAAEKMKKLSRQHAPVSTPSKTSPARKAKDAAKRIAE